MALNPRVRSAMADAAAAATIACALTVLTTGTASAAIGNNRIQLCAEGNYWAYLDFYSDQLAYLGSDSLVQSGTCATFNVPAQPSGSPLLVQIEGLTPDNAAQSFAVGSTVVTANGPGTKVRATGAAKSPRLELAPNN